LFRLIRQKMNLKPPDPGFPQCAKSSAKAVEPLGQAL
jgi:hypothetical protein